MKDEPGEGGWYSPNVVSGKILGNSKSETLAPEGNDSTRSFARMSVVSDLSTRPNEPDRTSETNNEISETSFSVATPLPSKIHGRFRSAGPRIMILGGDADNNLGDHAILFSLCQTLAEFDSRVRITVVSDRTNRYKFPGVVNVIPSGIAGSFALMRAAAKQDLITIGGGGLFQDDDSRVKMPFWASKVTALRAVNERIVAHSIGAGPLAHPESKCSANWTCSVLESISVRDEFAHKWLSSCTAREVLIVPDPAFMLRPAPQEDGDAVLQHLQIPTDKPIIGVALRRWFHQLGGFVPHSVRDRLGLTEKQNHEAMDRLLSQIADSLRALAARLNASILLLPTYNVEHEADVHYCRQLAERLPRNRVQIGSIDDPQVYKAVCGRLSLMISARMHPLILAASMGVPVVGLGYNGKFEGFFDMLGIPRRMIWMNEFRMESQLERLQQLAEDALSDTIDLRNRCELLAHRTARQTTALLGQQVVQEVC